MITTSSVVIQPKLSVVQRKVFVPVPNPVTSVDGLVFSVNDPVPVTKDHAPDPMVGVFPFKVASPLHTD